MPYTTSSQWGPAETPRVLRWLIVLTCCITLTSALITPLFHLAGFTGPQDILSLSWYGLKNYFIWQPFSYLFVQETSDAGIHFLFLLGLFFNMYILWVLGSILQQDIGTRHFLQIYLFIGALAGVFTVFMQYILGQYQVLYGPSAALLALFTVWTMQYSDSILSLFFLFPLKARWLLAGILGIIFFISISTLDFITPIFYFSAVFFAYLYGALFLNLKAPFPWMEPLDRFFEKVREKMEPRDGSKAKIFNLKGEPELTDDQFVDAMLTKISKYGERSLNATERARMEEISKRRSRKR